MNKMVADCSKNILKFAVIVYINIIIRKIKQMGRCNIPATYSIDC